MRILISLLIFNFLFVFVVTANAYPQSAYGWRGYNVNSLIQSWGTPDIKIVNAYGNTVLIYNIKTYETHNRQYSPSVGVNVNSAGRPVIVTSSPSMNTTDISLTCSVKFTVDKRGTIINTQMEGEGCTADRIHP